MRIGIDVGGTHTDAVLMNGDSVVCAHKALTTKDVASGISASISALLTQSGVSKKQIDAIMIGTTQFTNAVVERRNLSEVGVIRIALPSGNGCPPMCNWPKDLADAMGHHVYECHGGYLYDGYPVAEINEGEVDAVVDDIRRKGLDVVAISSAFSTMNAQPEQMFREKLIQAMPDVRVTMSHQIGSLGLLERENAAILNASLLPFADRVVDAFLQSLKAYGFRCPMFISQNDGTLMNADFVRQYPALTFASGPTNSLRGAFKLTGLHDAIVVDIGGTTSDIGVLQNGFPRQSNVVVDVGGVRTNFRMPDIKALGLGGGSYVSSDGASIGPQSCGHRLVEEGLVFGGNRLTATDIAVATGVEGVGDPANLSTLNNSVVQTALATMREMLNDNIEMMKPNAEPVPVILVGGGALLVQGELDCASRVLRPEHAGVANAIGAAIAQVGGESESLQSYSALGREQAIQHVVDEATQRAICAGAEAASIEVTEVEETEVPYMDGNINKVRVRVIGDLASLQANQISEVSA